MKFRNQFLVKTFNNSKNWWKKETRLSDQWCFRSIKYWTPIVPLFIQKPLNAALKFWHKCKLGKILDWNFLGTNFQCFDIYLLEHVFWAFEPVLRFFFDLFPYLTSFRQIWFGKFFKPFKLFKLTFILNLTAVRLHVHQ